MTTKKSTHMIVSTGKQDGDNPLKKQLEARAARFGVASSNASTISRVATPEDTAKLAARASRFSDLMAGAGSNKVAGATTSTSKAGGEDKLALRAARFSDITRNEAKNAKVAKPFKLNAQSASKGTDDELLAKRAARFASMETK